MVIAIIGILASLIIVSLRGAGSKVRDTKAKSNAANIDKALAQYEIDNSQKYPLKPIQDTPLLSLAGLVPNYLKTNAALTPATGLEARYVSSGDGASYAQAWELETTTEVAIQTGSGVYATDSLSLPGVVNVPGAKGSGILLSGSGQYLTTPYDAGSMAHTSFTVLGWARVDGGAGSWRAAVSLRRTGSTRGFSVLASNTNQWKIEVGTGITFPGVNGPLVVNGQWVFFAGTYSGSTLTLYIAPAGAGSPTPYSTTVSGYIPESTNPFRIGITSESVFPYPFSWNGAIDGVKFYNTALNQPQIDTIYNAGSGQFGDNQEANLKLAWRLNGSTDLTDYESSRVMTVVGSPTWATGMSPLGLFGIGGSTSGKAFVTYRPQ